MVILAEIEVHTFSLVLFKIEVRTIGKLHRCIGCFLFGGKITQWALELLIPKAVTLVVI